MFGAGEPFGALRVGEGQLRLAVGDSRREFGALPPAVEQGRAAARHEDAEIGDTPGVGVAHRDGDPVAALDAISLDQPRRHLARRGPGPHPKAGKTLSRRRSEEHTSELQSLMRISYAVFCLKKKKKKKPYKK